jgi:hypothetical protein
VVVLGIPHWIIIGIWQVIISHSVFIAAVICCTGKNNQTLQSHHGHEPQEPAGTRLLS